MVLDNFKGAIFDLDGTLIDSLSVWRNIWNVFGHKYLDGQKFNIAPTDDKAVRTMTLENAMNYLHYKYSLGKDGNELFIEARRIITEFYTKTVSLKKGVLEFLEYCQQKGIRMCLASATDIGMLNLAVDRCGIRKYFQHIISCAETGKGKDQPDIFEKALSLLHTSIEETWVFEDSYTAIETASNLGLKTVGIFDINNFDTDMVSKIATVFLGEGEMMQSLVE